MALTGLDEHISGGRYTVYEEEITCGKCSHKWDIVMASDYGQAGPIEDPVLCPECLEVVEC